MSVSPVQLQAVALRELSYTEIANPSQPPTAPGPGKTDISVEIGLQGTINIQSDSATGAPLIELLLSATVNPDALLRPITVKVVVGGLFSASPPIGLRELLGYVNEGGARLLFPYLREMVSAVTGRGVYGPIFLQPVILGPLRPNDELDGLIEQLSPGAKRG